MNIALSLKCTVSLHVSITQKQLVLFCIFADNAKFHFFSEYVVYCKSTWFYSTFLLTTISLTRCCHQKHEVSIRIFAENAQDDLKICKYEDNAEFHSAFLATVLSYATRFQQVHK
jgi:hypothetical protein